MRAYRKSTVVKVASAILLIIIALLFDYWARRQPNQQLDAIPPGFAEAVITSETVVGRWVRVSKITGLTGWREFSAMGHLSVRYGDMIFTGSYRILDNRTVETTYHIHSLPEEINEWTAGIQDETLIMVHRKWGWVEIYRRSASSTDEN